MKLVKIDTEVDKKFSEENMRNVQKHIRKRVEHYFSSIQESCIQSLFADLDVEKQTLATRNKSFEQLVIDLKAIYKNC
jgi:hypothetical protein